MNNLNALYLVTALFIIALIIGAYELDNSITKANELVQVEVAYANLNQSYSNLLAKYASVSNSSAASAALAAVYANLTTPSFYSLYANTSVNVSAATVNSTGLQTGYHALNFTVDYPGYIYLSLTANTTNVTALITRNKGIAGAPLQPPAEFAGAVQPYYWAVPQPGHKSANITAFLTPGNYSINVQNFNPKSPASATLSAEYASFNVK